MERLMRSCSAILAFKNVSDRLRCPKAVLLVLSSRVHTEASMPIVACMMRYHVVASWMCQSDMLYQSRRPRDEVDRSHSGRSTCFKQRPPTFESGKRCSMLAMSACQGAILPRFGHGRAFTTTQQSMYVLYLTSLTISTIWPCDRDRA